MTLDDKVDLLIGITGTLVLLQIQSLRSHTSREERKGEIESLRLVLPLVGTIYFGWNVLSGSTVAWMPWAAVASVVALIYGVVRVARQPR